MSDAAPICSRCLGEYWICEQHPKLPFPHDDCAGPGDPCPRCNHLAPTPEEQPMVHRIHAHRLSVDVTYRDANAQPGRVLVEILADGRIAITSGTADEFIVSAEDMDTIESERRMRT